MGSKSAPVYKFGDFRLDTGKRLLLGRDGASVSLTPKAYDILAYLVEHSGRIIDKEEIMRAVWPATAVEENNLTQNISRLRRLLGEAPGEHRYIATAPNRGYQFVAAVGRTEEVAHSAHEPDSEASIAVLPFVNVSADPDFDYFADGLADDLINSLSKMTRVRVAARTSAFSFKGRQIHVREIAGQLGVNLVLEGSVRKSGARLRITAQLVNAADGYQLWAERYDREIEMRDLFAVQDEITVAVMDALKVKLPGRERAAVLKRATEDTTAHELYLKGRFHLFHMTALGIEAGLACFEKAIAADPGYALGHAGLAHAYRMFGLSLDMPTCEVAPKAKAAALKAIEIDDTLAETHAVLAFTLYWYEWKMSEAASHFQRALELNPTSADTHWMCAHLPSNEGRHEEALRLIGRARQLDPLSGLINAMEGQFLLHAGHTAEAVARLREALELDPRSRVAHVFTSSAYIAQGRYDESIAEARAAHELAPSNTQPLAYQGYAHAKAGRRREARAILEQLIELSGSRYVPPFNIAMVYNGLEERRKALDWLERGVECRDPKLVFLKVDPKWRNLRKDPRFVAVLERVNLSSAEPPKS